MTRAKCKICNRRYTRPTGHRAATCPACLPALAGVQRAQGRGGSDPVVDGQAERVLALALRAEAGLGLFPVRRAT